MSKLSDTLKLIIAKMAIPTLLGLGEESAHEYLMKLAAEKPKKFAILIQSFYPTAKGVLLPFVKYTKTEFDDEAGQTIVNLLEEVMTELSIPIPVVIPIDFTTPDEDLPAIAA